MLPIHDVDQMREMDARLAAASSLQAAIGRAGYGVATLAMRMLGGAYGKRVAVIAGRGNNGNDGRYAAHVLSGWGAKVALFDYPVADTSALAGAELVIDAVFGFGFHGEFPGIGAPAGVPVLGVDVPSGLDAGSGTAAESTRAADVTIALAGLKTGQLIGDGPRLMGETYLYPLHGAPRVEASGSLIEPEDIRIAPGALDRHKWSSGIAVLAGSAGMMGAAAFVCSAALAAGAGIAHLLCDDPAAAGAALAPLASGTVSVQCEFGPEGWKPEPELSRYKAVVIGPGRGSGTGGELAALATRYEGPMVVDADAITALAKEPHLIGLLAARSATTVITPHAAELARLAKALGTGTDHSSLSAIAKETGSYLLVKGFPTRVYSPSGGFLAVPANGPALASAGTGDVLSGVLGARLAQGGPTQDAIAEAIVIHGLAAQLDGGDPVPAARLLGNLNEAIEMLRDFPRRHFSGAFIPVGASGPLYFARQSHIDWGAS